MVTFKLKDLTAVANSRSFISSTNFVLISGTSGNSSLVPISKIVAPLKQYILKYKYFKFLRKAYILYNFKYCQINNNASK